MGKGIVIVLLAFALTAYQTLAGALPDPVPSSFAYGDDILQSTMPLHPRSVNGMRVYVFSDTNQVVGVIMTNDAYQLEQALLVGGGGAGGNVLGGGGGGGGVLQVNRDGRMIQAGDVIRIWVGAGGAAAPTSDMDAKGSNGGDTTLVCPWGEFTAWGGGAGGSYSVSKGENGGSGGGGSGCAGTFDSAGGRAHEGNDVWGHNGGSGACSGSTIGGGGGGGGGGAGEHGSNGTSMLAGKGGEGVTNAITGVSDVYGSGGNGGGGVSAEPCLQTATHGGASGGKTSGSDCTGGAGDDGFGAGGGGGGYNGTNFSGGRGGNGVVVLAFRNQALPNVTGRLLKVVGTTAQMAFDVHGAGEGASTVAVSAGIAEEGNAPSKYETLGENLLAGQTVTHRFSGLSWGVRYDVVVRAVNDRQEVLALRVPFETRKLPGGYADGVLVSSAPLDVRSVDGSCVYVFSDTNQVIDLMVTNGAYRLEQVLLVGGGGAGGNVIGGGGGGGGVLLVNGDGRTTQVGDAFRIWVGAGGVAAAGSAKGANGGDTTFACPWGEFKAWGGGAGGTFSAENGEDGGSGGGGAGTYDVSSPGGHAQKEMWGHDGGLGATGISGGGGGGGAGEPGGNATSTLAGKGGEGVTNAITGVSEVYGSGGNGGGGVNTGPSRQTATHGGTGGEGSSASDCTGGSGDDGFGAGGGGGGYNGNYFVGGRGGNGTVILKFTVDPLPMPTSLMFAGFADNGTDKQYLKVHVTFSTPPADLGAWLADIRQRNAMVVKCAPTVEALSEALASEAVYRDGKGDQDIENGDIWIEVNLPTAPPVLYYQVSIRDDESVDYDQ